jgi:PAS domain S-box-containing protein
MAADDNEMLERLRALTECVPAMIWQLDLDRRAIYFNRAWLAFTGRTIEQEAGTGWVDSVHPDDVERCLATSAQAFAARQEYEMEYRLRRHDGEYRWILDHGAPLHTIDGTFLGYVGSGTDVTELRRSSAEPQDRAAQTFIAIGLVARAALNDMPDDIAAGPLALALTQVAELAATGAGHLHQARFADVELAADGHEFVPTLRRLVRSFQHRTGIEAALVVTGDQGWLPNDVAEVLQAVGMHALAFVEHQSSASAVVLGLRISQRSVTLSIHDDGATGRATGGQIQLALRDVGLRVRRMGGTFVARPGREGGFLVRTRLPLMGSLQGLTKAGEQTPRKSRAS